jgi:excisionase family DNA binding protein
MTDNQRRARAELLTVAEIAAELKLGTSTIWRRVSRGDFPKPIKIGGSTRWHRSDVEAFVQSLSDDNQESTTPTAVNPKAGLGSKGKAASLAAKDVDLCGRQR